MINEPSLLDFCESERQREVIEVYLRLGSANKTAVELKANRRGIDQMIKRIKSRAAIQGFSPPHDMNRTVPEGFTVKGVSTLYGKNGKVSAQWVKSRADENRIEEILKEFVLSLADDIKGLSPVVKPPEISNDDLLCVYPQGDPHFGLYSWWQDSGEDFDLQIAEKLTCGAIDRLISSAPKAKTALLLNLGDMFHADNQKNITNSGHQLDVDGRWAKVQQVGLRSIIYCIMRLLQHHEKVIFRINKGNHDGHSSYALALMISCYFYNEPRVQVDLSPSVTWYHSFGKVLIGSTHGDTIKGGDLVSVMAADKPEEWGKSKYRYWYVGHVHHRDVKEYRGGIVEYFRTLAARDAWHAGQGYRAGRDMQLIVLHKEYGEIERHHCDIAMVK